MSIDGPKKSGRGRPEVDSEQVRSRVERSILFGIDAAAASEPDHPPRAEMVRRILRDWLAAKGYLQK